MNEWAIWDGVLCIIYFHIPDRFAKNSLLRALRGIKEVYLRQMFKSVGCKEKVH